MSPDNSNNLPFTIPMFVIHPQTTWILRCCKQTCKQISTPFSKDMGKISTVLLQSRLWLEQRTTKNNFKGNTIAANIPPNCHYWKQDSGSSFSFSYKDAWRWDRGEDKMLQPDGGCADVVSFIGVEYKMHYCSVWLFTQLCVKTN